MIEVLKSKFLILEKNREKLYDKLEKLDEKQLNYRPSEYKWSIVQIVFHLVKTEQLSVISINKEIKNTKSRKAGLSAFLRSTLLKYSLISPLKFKAPPILGNMPKEYSINELKTKWSTVRIKLHNALGEINNELDKKYIFEHPYAGKFNIYQTMDFLIQHFNHHSRQIKKLAQHK